LRFSLGPRGGLIQQPPVGLLPQSHLLPTRLAACGWGEPGHRLEGEQCGDLVAGERADPVGRGGPPRQPTGRVGVHPALGALPAHTTRTGLTVHAELDPGVYPTGVTIPDQVMVALPLTAHDWHGTWNYTLRPEPPAPLAVPR
jgi:hypothetical protein